jgi:hypothetical protein
MLRLAFLGALLYSPPLHASTITATSCSLTDVNNAMSTAVAGDTVQIPGCTTNWGSFVVVKPGTTVQPVPGQTVIIGTTSEGFSLNQGTTNTRLTGFTCYRATNVPTDYNGHCLQVTNNSTGTWRLDHWTFCGGGGNCTTGNAIVISIFGLGPGLIDHNNFKLSGAAWIQEYADGQSNTAGWLDDITPGGLNMVYIEDNQFIDTACASNCKAGSEGFIQAYGGARNVIRYNTIQMNSIDQHGSAGGGLECGNGTNQCIGYVGVRWYEIYNNTFVFVPGGNWFSPMDIRAGSGVVFNNTVRQATGTSGAIWIQMREENGLAWPQAFQIGSGIQIGAAASPHDTCASGTLNTAPSYVWGNVGFNPRGGGHISTGQVPTTVAINRDYFEVTSSPTAAKWKEKAADTCTTTYNYTPAVHPHPLVAAPPRN